MTDRLTELLTDEPHVLGDASVHGSALTANRNAAIDVRNEFRHLVRPEVQALRDRVRELFDLVQEPTFLRPAPIGLDVLCVWCGQITKSALNPEAAHGDWCPWLKIEALRATLEGEATG